MTPNVWPPSATHPILVAVELDGSSEAAIGVGRDLAERYGAGVVLAHVYTAPAYPHLVTHREVIAGEAAAFEAKARAGLTALAGSVPDARTVLREGFPEEVLPQIIEELRPALVVVGFHGRKGVARAILGSVAEKVIRASVAPVLVARSAGTTALRAGASLLRRSTRDAWCVVRGAWRVVCGAWRVVRGAWCVVRRLTGARRRDRPAAA